MASTVCRSSKDNLGEVVRKAVDHALQADLSHLAAIAHQLLMLSTRGCRELVLRVRPLGCWLASTATCP